MRGYHCAEEPGETADGYLPGPGAYTACGRHDSDFQSKLFSIQLTELLRLIQFFNMRGYTCSPDPGATLDGFLPGPGDGCTCAEPDAPITETMLLTGDVPLTVVKVEPGTFSMGRYTDEQDSESDESPRHDVTFSYPFWVGQYEVTKAQWESVMGTLPWEGGEYVDASPESPAVYISWDDAQAFIAAMNASTGRHFRLPSEAEWEYVCRAGTTTRYFWGDDLSNTDALQYAWVS